MLQALYKRASHFHPIAPDTHPIDAFRACPGDMDENNGSTEILAGVATKAANDSPPVSRPPLIPEDASNSAEVELPSSLSRSSRQHRPRSSHSRSSSGRSSALTSASMQEGVPACSQFSLTPPDKAALSLLWTAKHWNTPRGPCCCPMRGQLFQLKPLVKYVQTLRCNPTWSPIVDWQCVGCYCLNIHARLECDVCGEPREMSVDDLESAPDRSADEPIVNDSDRDWNSQG